MIGRLRGVVLEKKAQEVILEVGGVGYEVMVPMTTVFQLPPTGQEATLHTHFVVRDDAQVLYGFTDVKERDMFRILIRVSGVGPKLALTILSGIEANEFVSCVQNHDINALVSLPGVGKKTAERLIMEVRDTLREWGLEEGEATVPGTPGGQSQSVQEAEVALVSLGYKAPEASRAVVRASRLLEDEGRTIDSESLIRLALKNMG